MERSATLGKPSFSDQWRRRRRVAVVFAVLPLLALAGAIALLASVSPGDHDGWRKALALALLVLLLASGPISYVNARCPACRAYLGKLIWFEDGCRACGARMND
jgi:hypothetical protein